MLFTEHKITVTCWMKILCYYFGYNVVRGSWVSRIFSRKVQEAVFSLQHPFKNAEQALCVQNLSSGETERGQSQGLTTAMNSRIDERPYFKT